jgi:DNA replication protein DnaC
VRRRDHPAATAVDHPLRRSQRIAKGRSIAITANRAPQDWYPLFPNPVVAESLLDRLINTSHQVFMKRPLIPAEQRPKASVTKA